MIVLKWSAITKTLPFSFANGIDIWADVNLYLSFPSPNPQTTISTTKEGAEEMPGMSSGRTQYADIIAWRYGMA